MRKRKEVNGKQTDTDRNRCLVYFYKRKTERRGKDGNEDGGWKEKEKNEHATNKGINESR